MPREKIKGGMADIFQTASGSWAYQTGYGHGRGFSSRSEAVKRAESALRAGKRQEKRAAKPAKPLAATCGVAGCYGPNTTTHRNTAKHRNAIAYSNYRR